jgi:hypothetical protein
VALGQIGIGGTRAAVTSVMSSKHADSPGGPSAEDELNQPTRESMEQLGRADLDEQPEPTDREQEDDSQPGQNSDWLPE